MNGVTWIQLPRRAGMGLIRVYQRALSPLLAPRCRFYPSCSHYAHESLSRHGLIKGLALTLWRLLRCHPFHPGGYDPPPTRPTPAGRK